MSVSSSNVIIINTKQKCILLIFVKSISLNRIHNFSSDDDCYNGKVKLAPLIKLL